MGSIGSKAVSVSTANAAKMKQDLSEFSELLDEQRGTTSTNKSQEQIFAETDELKSLPSGTQIEVQVDGQWVTYTAHDQARMGRNGRMLRIRRYSIVESNTTNRNLPPVVTRDTSDPYYIAENPWRRKKR